MSLNFACSVQIISRLESQSKFQTFTLFSGRQHGGSILGSVNFCITFRKYLKFSKPRAKLTNLKLQEVSLSISYKTTEWFSNYFFHCVTV